MPSKVRTLVFMPETNSSRLSSSRSAQFCSRVTPLPMRTVSGVRISWETVVRNSPFSRSPCSSRPTVSRRSSRRCALSSVSPAWIARSSNATTPSGLGRASSPRTPTRIAATHPSIQTGLAIAAETPPSVSRRGISPPVGSWFATTVPPRWRTRSAIHADSESRSPASSSRPRASRGRWVICWSSSTRKQAPSYPSSMAARTAIAGAWSGSRPMSAAALERIRSDSDIGSSGIGDSSAQSALRSEP